MSGQKKLFNRKVKIIYKDVENANPIVTRYQRVTPVDADGREGITLQLRRYFCKRRLWDEGFDFFTLHIMPKYSNQEFLQLLIRILERNVFLKN